MGKYDFRAIETKWQAKWKESKVFRFDAHSNGEKFYVLDMFPYPSGAGLHVGHPLGYIATDIVARYQRLLGKNVLHPMGFDAFGLPAENYAIRTGQHPAHTTESNIKRYKEQLEMLGLGYSEGTEVRTCDPDYYRWTQWIFIQFFQSWYNTETQKAEPIDSLIAYFEKNGSQALNASCSKPINFTAQDWKSFSESEKSTVLMNYRLAYTDFAMVNWCPALGTVLANEEVKDGLSERGGHPVERKPMRQWMLRITAYAERLLNDLETLDWPQSVIEMQRNWIGRSEGASILFSLQNSDAKIEVFTTRPDTIFGVHFLVLAPEHPLVPQITSADQKVFVEAYIEQTSHRSERDRLAEQKRVSGAFTGAYVIHPFTGQTLPVWISDYVLAGYGTGAVMAVPSSDSRDFLFAQHFSLPITPVIEGTDLAQGANETKDGFLINSDFLNGKSVKDATQAVIQEIEKREIGKRLINYRLRDAIFSRQRYWGEPFPIVYTNGVASTVADSELPVTLPEVESYRPTGTGESPIAAVKSWVELPDGKIRETDTMPGWAGSSWYFLRYVDAQNSANLGDKALLNRWLPVDLYVGGAEHAVAHLLYSRFWTKFLFDRGYISFHEPFKKLVNQGMIQGRSSIAYRSKDSNTFVSAGLVKNEQDYIPIHVDVNFVKDDKLDLIAFKADNAEYANAEFVLEDGQFFCAVVIEKMSKSLLNVVNPDKLCTEYGADTFRLYEMFLGPLEQHKPWNTNGITGVFNFLRKAWNLFIDDNENLRLTNEPASADELKILHQTIKKAQEDIENLSFNTAVPQFMIFVNEMQRLKCYKKAVLEPFLVLLSPFAPHFSEELWERLGHAESILYAQWPEYNETYLVENECEYPISINGKVRAKLVLPLSMSIAEVEAMAKQDENVKKHLADKEIRKVIVIHGKIVNIVV